MREKERENSSSIKEEDKETTSGRGQDISGGGLATRLDTRENSNQQ